MKIQLFLKYIELALGIGESISNDIFYTHQSIFNADIFKSIEDHIRQICLKDITFNI